MIAKIGENAGAIWGALQNGAQGLKALKKATKLKNEELYLALVGWLARVKSPSPRLRLTLSSLWHNGNCYCRRLGRRRTGIAGCS